MYCITNEASSIRLATNCDMQTTNMVIILINKVETIVIIVIMVTYVYKLGDHRSHDMIITVIEMVILTIMMITKVAATTAAAKPLSVLSRWLGFCNVLELWSVYIVVLLHVRRAYLLSLNVLMSSISSLKLLSSASPR